MSPIHIHKKLYLTEHHFQEMLLMVTAQAPEEACGILAGQVSAEGWQVRCIFPAVNALHSPVRYRIDPEEQYKIFMKMEELELELVGIYHSHPMGPALPSATDISEAYYPEAVYLIWMPDEGGWKCHGFNISGQKVEPIQLIIAVEEQRF